MQSVSSRIWTLVAVSEMVNAMGTDTYLIEFNWIERISGISIEAHLKNDEMKFSATRFYLFYIFYAGNIVIYLFFLSIECCISEQFLR